MPEAPVPTDLTGTILAGRYKILKKLGEGAMGAVYLGEHLKIGRHDAIKVLRDGLSMDPESIARFNRGARNVAAIRHPNVYTVYDYSDTADGIQFMAMQFVPGESLKELIDREGALSLDRAVHIAKQTADALQAAHEAGIVHRDLKPANIMISKGRDGRDLVTVVDFDIAKGSAEGEGNEVTRLGFVVGTPEYMSPEQLTGDKLDGRSDIYSLALVFFRILTGALPFSGQTTQDLMIQRLTNPPLRLDQVMPGVAFPPALYATLERALQRRPQDRHESAGEFGEELVEALRSTGASPTPRTAGARSAAANRAAEGVPQTRVSAPMGGPTTVGMPGAGGVPEPKPAWRNPLVLGGAGLAAIAVVVAAVLALGGGGEGETPQTLTQNTPEIPQNTPQFGPIAGELANSPTGQPNNPAGATQQNAQNANRGQPSGTASNAGTNAASANPAPSVNPAPAAQGIQLAQVTSVLNRQFDNLESTSRQVLMSVADTSGEVYRTTGVGNEDKAQAAFIASSAWFALENSEQCEDWINRALAIRDSNAFRTQLRACQEQGR